MTITTEDRIRSIWELMYENWTKGRAPSPSANDLAREAYHLHDPDRTTDEIDVDKLANFIFILEMDGMSLRRIARLAASYMQEGF